jgi:hypothetical protein
MARNDDSGCGCLLIIVALWLFGGLSVGEIIAIIGIAWLGYLAFIGVSLGVVLAITKAFMGK